uniref:Heat shock protein 70 n=1 Tax=Panagrolaimus sp. ES5 TaxID=591445 RepID=A0AC34FX10_9BILA
MIGGRDFDRLLIDYFTDRLLNEFNIDVTKDQKKKYRLYSECLKIKHNLSTSLEDRIDVDDFCPDNDNLIPITRQIFEDKAQSLLFKIRSSITAVFKDVPDCRIDQISKVLLVGGGCRMPMIKSLLKSKFPNASLCCEEQPEEVVATGAAMYAYHLKTEPIRYRL